MDQHTSDHISYLNIRITKLKENPRLNQEQVKAYERVLKIAIGSSSYEDYTKQLGTDSDLFSIAKSEQIDRYRSMKQLYEKFGLEENANVYSKREEVALACQNYAELATKLPQTLSPVTESEANEKINQSAVVLQLLFQINTLANVSHQKEKAKQTKQEYLRLQELDPKFKIDSYFQNPYRLLNPFTKSQLNRLVQRIEFILGEKL
ncbi:MAG: hypothetical protein IBJ01_01655 [Leptospira sp.]|uniref:Uncharacterized protein n=1 Tax=Leptospira paudalimensis TaxID=2950024 RepID=A0ABT3M8I9_9LEPT|nr:MULTISPECIES: hypothetical protein [Leptospira]MBL0953455.1 hypothetical protein [Leptospira sp.]MCW7504701.1 hypothetical protein [Leptospira paudalimensis]